MKKLIQGAALAAALAVAGSASAQTYEFKALGQPVATGLIQKNVEQPFFENFAERTGIEALRATTREVPDYDELMTMRLGILEKHKLGIADIQEVIAGMDPLPGAAEALDWLRQNFQVVILSDTFYEFAMPLMAKLGYPALLCHKLEVSESGQITNYLLRQRDPKRQSVRAFQLLNYRVIAAGDSYNDTTMLGQAEAGILFHAPENVIAEFPQFPAVHDFNALRKEFLKASAVHQD